MDRRLFLGNSAILGGLLGLYVFTSADGWAKWLVLVGAAIILVGGLWQDWQAMRQR